MPRQGPRGLCRRAPVVDEAEAELTRLCAIRQQAYEGPPVGRGRRGHRGRRHPAVDRPGVRGSAIAREAEDLKELFEEQAGILEYDAGLPRAEAQLKAAKLTATLARIGGTPGRACARRSRDTPCCSAVDRRSR